MAETLSLMEFLQALLTDAGLRGGFGDDPQGTLAAHGLAELTPADVHDALVLVQDTQTVDYSLDTAAVPPPPPPAGDGHEAAVEYLARYLAGPQPADAAEWWTDPDGGLGDAPVGSFGSGDDTWHGTVADLAADDPGWTAHQPVPEPVGGDTFDLDDIGHLDDFDDHGGFADLVDDLPDGHDGGPALPEGA